MVVFACVYVVLAAVTYKDYGITSDEEVNYRAGKLYLTYLVASPHERLAIDQTVTPKDAPQDYPAFRLYPGLVAVLNPGAGYETAHLLNLLFGFMGFVLVYLLVWELTHSHLAVLAPIMLLLNPYYFGHVPANPKDVPFATLYLVCVYLLMRLRTNSLASYLAVGSSGALLVATRLVGAILVPVFVLRVLVDTTMRTPLVKKCLYCALAGLTAGLVLYAAWPFLWNSPVAKVAMLIKTAEAFEFWDRKILFNGLLITKTDRPWYYLFTYLAYKTPLLTMAGVICSILTAFRKVVWLLAIVVANLAAYLVLQPVVYNEMRHFLYLVPLLTVLAAVGVIKLMRSPKRWVALGTAVVVYVGLAKSAYDFGALHPYQYVYFNELAGTLAHVSTRYEVDYWSASYKESSAYLRTLAGSSPTPLKVYPCNLDFGVSYYAQGTFVVVPTREAADYILCDPLNALKKDLVLEDKLVFRVVRKGTTLSYVAKMRN